MEIIKRGRKTKRTCHCCGCVFTYNNKDIGTSTCGKNPFTSSQTVYYNIVACPDCGEVINLGLNTVIPPFTWD